MAIILDASASIDEDNFILAKGFAKRLLKRFTISQDNSRVSILSYSQRINIQSRFSDDQDERKLEDILENTFYEGSSTSTGKAIKFVNFEVFSTKSGSRIGNPGKQFIEQQYKENLYEDSVYNRSYIHKQLGKSSLTKSGKKGIRNHELCNTDPAVP